MALTLNKVYRKDCVKGLADLDEGSVDLAFADPPFNIGYDYDVYEDKQSSAKYLDWSRKWIEAVWPALKPNGTFWLAIGDEYAAELKLISQEIGFSCRSWVIWYYTFGVNCKRGFSRSHTHLFHFVKDPEDFTFNADDPAIRVPSARQLVYGDKRANPRGRLPDNTWVLRPQDVPDSFSEEEDTWFFSRVAGTFKEREGFHGCQMPEQLLGRIIRCCSNPADVVLDPFGGSGTTFVAAKKLDRRWIGFELSKDYVKRINERLKETKAGSLLDGAANPLTSAPATNSRKARRRIDGKRVAPSRSERAAGESKSPPQESTPVEEKSKAKAKPKTKAKRKPKAEPKNVAEPKVAAKPKTAAKPKAAKNSKVAKSKPTKKPKAAKKPKAPKAKPGESNKPKRVVLTEDLQNGIVAAFTATHDGFSTDRVLADPALDEAFLDACRKSGLQGDPADWNRLLLRIRKKGNLPHVKHQGTVMKFKQMDPFSHGSEIAMHQMAVDHGATLDEVFCDPALAKTFDEIAARFAPGHSPFEYRWAAFSIRKRAKRAKKLAAEHFGEWFSKRLPRRRKLSGDWTKHSHPGVYIVSKEKTPLYVGEALDIRPRIEKLRDCPAWQDLGATSIIAIREEALPHALQSMLIGRTSALLNASEHLKPDLEEAA